MAWKLWGHTEEMLLRKGGVRLRRVFVTTLLNPKALIFAFAIIPFGLTLEGVVSKLADQPYRSGKNPGWVKVKSRVLARGQS